MKLILLFLALFLALANSRQIRHHDHDEEESATNKIMTEAEEEFGIDAKDSLEEMEEAMEEMEEEMEDEMEEDTEEKYKLRTEKCLISLAKTCDLKSFCHNKEKKLVPLIVGKDKIEGGKCPQVDQNIDDFKMGDGNEWSKCNSKNCTYCSDTEKPVDVCFLCYNEEGLIVDQKEVSAQIQCEESYWKRFKKGQYTRKETKEWYKHHKKYVEKCRKEWDHSQIKMTVSSCSSTCEVKST